MSKANQKVLAEKPDFDDPFSPDPDSKSMVYCIHCDKSYSENEIKWSPQRRLWVCKFYPNCDGAGLGWDIKLEKGVKTNVME